MVRPESVNYITAEYYNIRKSVNSNEVSLIALRIESLHPIYDGCFLIFYQ